MSMTRYEYKGYHGAPSVCGLEIRALEVGTLVVVTELPDNPGTSVTNMAENLATDVCRANNISPHKLIWVEHYPERGTPLSVLPETWDEVFFDFDYRVGSFTKARWSRMSEGFREALGLAVSQ